MIKNIEVPWIFALGRGEWIQRERDYFEFLKVRCQNNRFFRTSLRLWSSSQAFFSQYTQANAVY